MKGSPYETREESEKGKKMLVIQVIVFHKHEESIECQKTDSSTYASTRSINIYRENMQPNEP